MLQAVQLKLFLLPTHRHSSAFDDCAFIVLLWLLTAEALSNKHQYCYQYLFFMHIYKFVCYFLRLVSILQ